MKRKKRVLVLFILAVVLVCGLVLYNTPPAEKFHPLDGYTGKAPWDFGGLSDDGKTVYVTQTSLHTLSYLETGHAWRRKCGKFGSGTLFIQQSLPEYDRSQTAAERGVQWEV